jgi:hypothetical protein
MAGLGGIAIPSAAIVDSIPFDFQSGIKIRENHVVFQDLASFHHII